jgi:enamine deaminase RidA (YjgF/YER057c/UK114 family)
VAGIIIGARLGVREHLADNLKLFDFALDDEDRAALAPGLEALGFPPGNCGDEYRKPPYLTAAGDLSDHFDAFPSPYPVASGPGARLRALTGTVWEDLAGFSRAMRVGNRILVSGTTATHGDRVIGGNDPASQLHFCVDKIEGAMRALGGRIEDVVRTRIYIRNMEHWEQVSRAHGARFGDIRPANTLVQAGIIGDDYLVEMEVEAVTGGR